MLKKPLVGFTPPLLPMKRHYGAERAGFTLIELMIVVVIIGILAAVALPRFINQQRKARESAAWADIISMAQAFENYLLDCDNYPTGTPGTKSTSYGLKHLVINVDSESSWAGPYIRFVRKTDNWPNDPWHQPYEYEGMINGSDYIIWCKGGGYTSDYSATYINPGVFMGP